jgi:uncharacterized protein YydD (DUF2326 family)
MIDFDLDRLEYLEAELMEPDAELRSHEARLAGAYKQRGGRIVIDLTDAKAIQRRAEIREEIDANRIEYGSLRVERDRLRRLARAEEMQGRAA